MVITPFIVVTKLLNGGVAVTHLSRMTSVVESCPLEVVIRIDVSPADMNSIINCSGLHAVIIEPAGRNSRLILHFFNCTGWGRGGKGF